MQVLRNPAVLVYLNDLAAILFVAAYYLTGHCFCGNEVSPHHLLRNLVATPKTTLPLSGEMTVLHQCKSFPWLYQQSYG